MANITLVLNETEQQALNQLLDTALRQAGLNALDVVSHFMGRILAAQAGAQPKAQPAVPVQPAPVNGPAANANPNAPAQHQSILSHLIGEITGAGQSQPETHPAASAETASAAAPSLPASAPEALVQTTQSAAASTPAATR